jgi:hypothetical protein
MSSREYRQVNPVVGINTPYHHIAELIEDRERIEQLADASEISRRNVRKDECGQWTISGVGGHVQTAGDPSSYLLHVAAYSARKWGAIKRKAKTLGWEVKQDGDDEGCFRVGLPNEHQSEYLRALLGLRRRRQATAPMSAIGGKADIPSTSLDVRY